MKELEAAIKDFLDSSNRNQWVDGNEVQIYLRKGRHLFEHQAVSCLDLASISVTEKYQNQGLGTQSVKILLELNPFEFLYVENVLNDKFFHTLTKNFEVHVDERFGRSVFIKKNPLI